MVAFIQINAYYIRYTRFIAIDNGNFYLSL